MCRNTAVSVTKLCTCASRRRTRWMLFFLFASVSVNVAYFAYYFFSSASPQRTPSVKLESLSCVMTEDWRDRASASISRPYPVSIMNRFSRGNTYATSRASIPKTCFPATTKFGYFDKCLAETFAKLPLIQYDQLLAQAEGNMGRNDSSSDNYARSTVRLWTTARLDIPPERDVYIVNRTLMAGRSRMRYCMASNYFREEHVPLGGCPAATAADGNQTRSNRTGPQWVPQMNGYPWCYRPSDPIHIFSADCVIIDNYISHEDVGFTLFNYEGVFSTDRGRWKISVAQPMMELEEAGTTGAIEYPHFPGHFMVRTTCCAALGCFVSVLIMCACACAE